MLTVGDKIKCVKDVTNKLTAGNLYTFSGYYVSGFNSNGMAITQIVIEDPDTKRVLNATICDFDDFDLDSDISKHKPYNPVVTGSNVKLTVNGTVIGYADSVSFTHNLDIGDIKVFCDHSWKKYHGLVEQYEYCEKCNEKKG